MMNIIYDLEKSGVPEITYILCQRMAGGSNLDTPQEAKRINLQAKNAGWGPGSVRN